MAFHCFYMTLSIDKMDGYSLSNKTHLECLLKKTKGDAVLVTHVILGDVSKAEH